jgi:hypothetical protein
MKYTNYTNIDACFVRAYEPGDRLVKGWAGEIDGDPETPLVVLEALFMRHNRDDRPDGRLCPSMSIGDVVVLGESAYSVASFGFKGVTLDPADLITDRTWTEMI